MIKYAEEEVVRKFIEDVFCNKCTKSLKEGNFCDDYDGIEEVVITGGFGSKLGDGTELRFSLCMDCILELVKTFKIEPERWDDND